MVPISKMSDTDLRIALASAFPHPWVNIRMDKSRGPIGDVRGTLSERADGIPNWPGDIATARFLEDTMKTYGLHDEYVHNLREAMQTDYKSIPSPSARYMSEAALMTLRGTAACIG
jgi:hypothetical protein